MYVKVCKNCEERFMVEVRDSNFPGGKDREPVICPYCDEDNGYEVTNGSVSTKKFEDSV